jgi:hypothetical protein
VAVFWDRTTLLFWEADTLWHVLNPWSEVSN